MSSGIWILVIGNDLSTNFSKAVITKKLHLCTCVIKLVRGELYLREQGSSRYISLIIWSKWHMLPNSHIVETGISVGETHRYNNEHIHRTTLGIVYPCRILQA